MKYTSLLLGLLLCGAARADSVTLAGVIHSPGENIFYSLTVDRTAFPTFLEDELNGTVRVTGGGPQENILYQDDLFLFLPTESITLAQFGFPKMWELDDTPSGLVLHDPPSVATPEPSADSFAFVIFLCILVMFLTRPRVRK